MPLLWAGMLSALLKFPLDLPLLKAAWLVGRDGNVGRMALGTLHKQAGLEIARAQGNIWMDRHPRPQIAALAGAFAVEAGDVQDAYALLERGRACGDDPDGALDMLEYGLAAQSGDPALFGEVLGRFKTRRDLPPLCSKLVLTELALQAMFHAQWDQAQGLALRLLAIEDVPTAEMVLWAFHRHQGNDAQAQRHLLQAKFARPGEKLFLQALGAMALGAQEEVQQCLDQLREESPSAAANLEAQMRLREAPA